MAKGDRLLDMGRVKEGAYLLVIGERGLGKLTRLENYMPHHRGTSGVLTLKITDRTGPVAAARVVHPDEELMIISTNGIMIRTTLRQVRVTGRAAQGVRIMDVDKGDTVASIASFDSSKDDGPDEPDSDDVKANGGKKSNGKAASPKRGSAEK